MEELEKKIEDLMHNSVWKLLPPEKYLPLIASEVQDIAIAFAEWKSKLSPSDLVTVHPPAGSGACTGLYTKSDTALFTEFIKQYK